MSRVPKFVYYPKAGLIIYNEWYIINLRHVSVIEYVPKQGNAKFYFSSDTDFFQAPCKEDDVIKLRDELIGAKKRD